MAKAKAYVSTSISMQEGTKEPSHEAVKVGVLARIKHHDQNQLGKGWIHFAYTFILYSINKGKSSIYTRQVRETGPEAETTEELCLHRLVPHGLLSMLSYTGQDRLPCASTTYNRLSPPTSISN